MAVPTLVLHGDRDASAPIALTGTDLVLATTSFMLGPTRFCEQHAESRRSCAAEAEPRSHRKSRSRFSTDSRLAAAEVMSRPELTYLAPTSYNNAINGQPQLYYNGTSGLMPIRANQADLSVEWYYHPHSAFTLALFDKKIRDDIYTGATSNVDLGTIQCVGGPPGKGACTPFPWTVYAPANGAKSDFYGIELACQHILDIGLGAHAQYTRTWNKSFDQNGSENPPINAVPPLTLSAGLFYDKGRFNVDVNWDYAASYQYACSQCTEIPGWPAISSPFQWVTASAHYKIIKEFQVYVEGQEFDRFGGPHLPERQPLVAVGERPECRPELQRRRSRL